MLISRNRQKLIQAAVFFASNTQGCGKVKLFKLLYLLDFAHFRETGRSVTGLDYVAWKLGPVPLELAQEWDQLEPDLAAAVEIVPEKVIDHIRERVVPRIAFDDSHFTRRELSLMQRIAKQHETDLSQPMVNVTHEERGPWATIWDNGRGSNERIPYTLGVSESTPNREAVLEAARDFEAIATASKSSN
ncbi:MAG: SocA family protein [Steroidobacteraceae bacterium]|nr:SocA family protein [Steroidobacteraceae bacterium]